MLFVFVFFCFVCSVLVETCFAPGRMQCEEAVRKQEEMQEALQEERFHNQE